MGLLPDPPTDGVPRLGDDVSGAAAGTARPGLQPPACRGMRWPVQECISWASKVCVLPVDALAYVLGFSLLYVTAFTGLCAVSPCRTHVKRYSILSAAPFRDLCGIWIGRVQGSPC